MDRTQRVQAYFDAWNAHDEDAIVAIRPRRVPSADRRSGRMRPDCGQLFRTCPSG
jgi:hypothetical protein